MCFTKSLSNCILDIPDVSRTYDKQYRHCHIYALEGRTVSQNFNQIETRYIFENVSQFFFSCGKCKRSERYGGDELRKTPLAPDISERVTVAEVGKCLYVLMSPSY